MPILFNMFTATHCFFTIFISRAKLLTYNPGLWVDAYWAILAAIFSMLQLQKQPETTPFT